MAVDTEFDDWWSDVDLEEEEDPLNDLVSCPQCGAEIYEDTPQCPFCGDYVVQTSSGWSGRPSWWILLGLLGALATVLALTMGL